MRKNSLLVFFFFFLLFLFFISGDFNSISIQRQTVPVVNPGTTPTSGRTWCIASSNASPSALNLALNYACGYGGADCSEIQPNGPCYDPDTVRDHASYAFNSYYQRNPNPISCVFGGTAQLSNTDPSYGNCRFASSANINTNTIPNPPAIPMTPASATTNPYVPGAGGYGGSEPAGYDNGNEPPSSAQSLPLSLLLISISYLILTAFVAHHS